MHLLVRENRTLDEQEVAEDLNLPSADLVVLSFTESDLLALRHAEALLRAQTEEGILLPTLQVTSLARLRHPMSIDLYIDTTLQKARCVVVRLLGGLDYWRYGAEELAAWSRETGVPLVLLPGDTLQSHSSDVQQQAAHTGDDGRLAQLSTVSAEHYARLNGFFQQGGPDNICAALALMSALAGMQEDKGTQPKALPTWCVYRSYAPTITMAQAQIKAVILLYRAHLLIGDVAGPECLAEELAQRGCAVDIVYVTSLKDPSVAKDVSHYLQSTKPDCCSGCYVFFCTKPEWFFTIGCGRCTYSATFAARVHTGIVGRKPTWFGAGRYGHASCVARAGWHNCNFSNFLQKGCSARTSCI